MRPDRIKYAGAAYHIMNRGAGGKLIYSSDADKHLFLSILQRVRTKYSIDIFAYCLMNNHYHLLVRTPLANISPAMCLLNGYYAKRFNFKNRIKGPLFGGRFLSPIVVSDPYLLQASKYIHLNPVAAGMVAHPKEYFWSSYRYFSSAYTKCSWLSYDEILEYFGSSRETACRNYQQFVNNSMEDYL